MSSDAWQVGLRGQSSVRAFVRSRVRSFTVDKDALEEKAQDVVLPSKGRQFRLMRQATRLSATAASILKGACARSERAARVRVRSARRRRRKGTRDTPREL